MNKLYYDDPLVAAYMAREFGVRLFSNNSALFEFKEIRGEFGFRDQFGCIVTGDKFYVKHSDHIFKPMVGDLISWTIGHTKYDKEVIVKSVELNGQYDLDFTKELFENPEYSYLGANILQRNVKQFFMPKVVQDDE